MLKITPVSAPMSHYWFPFNILLLPYLLPGGNSYFLIVKNK